MTSLRATYRIQLTPDLGFADVVALVPYLRDLGVSHLYLSPVFEACTGSEHGYDVTDPRRLRTALGGAEGFAELVGAVGAAGLGLVLDLVPNHMAADAENPFWCDVLRHGRGSQWAPMFDIDWDAGGGRVQLPVLSAPCATLLDEGSLTVEHDAASGAGWLVADGMRFPLAPGSEEALAGRAPASRAALEGLLAGQHYELLDWYDGRERVNYRRFFDVTELAAVRVEDPHVLRTTHELVLELVERGEVDALRVDHVDGLRDPPGYLRSLRDLVSTAAGGRPVAVIVEKILQPGEHLPGSWDAGGTTGYDFMRAADALFVDPEGLDRIRAHASGRLGLETDYAAIVASAKREALRRLLTPELDRLTRLARPACGDGVGDAALREAIVEVTAWLPVYRTYLRTSAPAPRDREHLRVALDGAAGTLGAAHPGLHALRPLLEPDGAAGGDLLAAWQQTTGPVMAKGLEDTALYRHVVLTALNEVGGSPVLPPDPLGAWHEAQEHRCAAEPAALSATSTHDTKRSEDVRARIGVLSEFADQWTAALDRWLAWHAGARKRTANGASPTREEEVLFYQSLLGVWPMHGGLDEGVTDRLAEYLVKAAREAGLRTSWIDPDEAHEQALRDFASAIALGSAGERFRADVIDLRRKTAFFGAVSCLSRVVLRATAPGIPDCYQGCELWNPMLVDPDNRRAVDFDRCRSLLATLHHERGAEGMRQRTELLVKWSDGRIKLWTIASANALRRQHPGLFARGGYTPLEVSGVHARRLCAFARTDGQLHLVVVVPRLVARLTTVGRWPLGRGAWQDTTITLPDSVPSRLTEWFTGAAVARAGNALAAGDVLATYPVAILVGETA